MSMNITIICLILFASIPSGFAQKSCNLYLAKLLRYLLTDVHKFQNQMAPYVLLSGKAIDDLGYPGSCQRDENDYMYSTVEISFVEDQQKFYGFMGFCFVEYCSAEQLTNNAGFIINYILEDYHTPIKSTFIDPQLQMKFSPLAFSFCMLFCFFIVLGMIAPIKKWVKLCFQSENQQYIIKSTYIDLQNPNNQLDDDETLDSDAPLIQKISIYRKWKYLMQPELSNKIYGFSLIKVLAVPLLIYSQIFAESNNAAYNYISYVDSVYGRMFSKIALFGYYIPDLFFMISAYLFTYKLLNSKISEQTPMQILSHSLISKLVRLYPIYVATLIIYWCISPYLHCGPVWYVYQQQAAQCNVSWWRALILIDNWFPSSTCYAILWFVQCEIQFVICGIILFICYWGCRKVSYGLFAIAYITSFVLLFVLSGEMVVTLDIALDISTHNYFRSFYSHYLYYLTGMLIAYLVHLEKTRNILKITIKNKIIKMVCSVVCLTLVLLILLRPSLWAQSQHSLAVQLALCRTGILIVFSYLCMICIFAEDSSKYLSSIHKYAYYTYPIILVSSLIIQGSYWSVGSFMYVSGSDLINATLPSVMISIPVGISVGLIVSCRN